MTYRITYETADGTVEDFTCCRTKLMAVRTARECAKGSSLNAVFGVTRWFIEAGDTTLLTFKVAS
jgi:hypothetical protein